MYITENDSRLYVEELSLRPPNMYNEACVLTFGTCFSSLHDKHRCNITLSSAGWTLSTECRALLAFVDDYQRV